MQGDFYSHQGSEPGLASHHREVPCRLIFRVRLAWYSYEPCRRRVITGPSSKIQTWYLLKTP